MNIFFLSWKPALCAKYHNNKHVVKMCIEYAQLLSTAHRVLDNSRLSKSYDRDLCRSTHVNHPCAIWVRESSANYLWLYDLFVELLKEYTFRYGKQHALTRLVKKLGKLPKNIQVGKRTRPALAMPDQYKVSSVVTSYRLFYMGAKRHLAQWKIRKQPTWYI